MRARTRRWALFVERAVRFALGGALLMALYTLLNPFGAVSSQDEHNRQTWQRLYANSYGDAEVRKRITVVTLNDGDIASLQPSDGVLDAAHYAKVIQTVAYPDGSGDPQGRAVPRAILVDLLLGDAAPAVEAVEPLLERSADCDALKGPYDSTKVHLASPFRCLVQVIADITHYETWRHWPGCPEGNQLKRLWCIRKAKGIPVMIAMPVDPRDPRASALSLGARALTAVAIEAPIIVSVQQYTLVTPETDVPLASGKVTLSPAALLYAAGLPACDLDGSDTLIAPGKCPMALNGVEDPGWSRAFRRPVDVIWGVGARSDHDGPEAIVRGAQADNLFFDGRGEPRCTQRAAGLGGQLLAVLRVAVDTFERSAVPCLYAQHVNYSALAYPKDPDLRRRALAGKIVLLGLDSPESGDYLPAGPDVARPGVFYHAMATDNLLTAGAHYSKPPQSLAGDMRFNTVDLANVLATFLMLLYLGAIRQFEQPSIVGAPLRKKRAAFLRAILLTLGGAAWMLLVFAFGSLLQLFGWPTTPTYAAVALVVLLEMARIFQHAFAPILELAKKREHWMRLILGPSHPAERS